MVLPNAPVDKPPNAELPPLNDPPPPKGDDPEPVDDCCVATCPKADVPDAKLPNPPPVDAFAAGVPNDEAPKEGAPKEEDPKEARPKLLDPGGWLKAEGTAFGGCSCSVDIEASVWISPGACIGASVAPGVTMLGYGFWYSRW